MYMFELFNWYSAGLSVIILAITEIIIVQYIYGFKRFMKNIQEDMGIWVPLPLYGYWAVTWCCITPLALSIIFVLSIYYYSPAYWGDYVFPADIQTLGWFITVCSIAFIPMGAAWVLWKGEVRGIDLITATEVNTNPFGRQRSVHCTS